MLTWDYQLMPYRASLARLDQAKRLEVAFAAIAVVHDTAIHVLREGPSDAADFFQACSALIRPAKEVSAISENDSKSLLDSTSRWLSEASAGVRDVCMSVIMILQRAGRTLTDSDVFGIMSYAYQIVLYSEVLAKLEREVTEAEVRRMETESAKCTACITAHIRLIVNAVNGDRI